jgi:hypothetical protein
MHASYLATHVAGLVKEHKLGQREVLADIACVLQALGLVALDCSAVTLCNRPRL